MEFKITCPVYPTENKDVVLSGLQNLFPDCVFNYLNNQFTTVCENLDYFFDILDELELRDFFFQELETNSYILLNKQAALHNKILFDDEQPLGSIKVMLNV